MERLLGTLPAFHMQDLRVHLGSCGAPSCYGAPSWCLVSGRQPKRTAVANETVGGRCLQATYWFPTAHGETVEVGGAGCT